MPDDLMVVGGDVFIEHGKIALIPIGNEYKIPAELIGLAAIFQVQPGGPLQVAINADTIDGTIMDVTLFKPVTNRWLTPNEERYVGNVITGQSGRVLVCDPALVTPELKLDLSFQGWWSQFENDEGTGLILDLEIVDWLDITEDFEKIEIWVRNYDSFDVDDEGGEEEYVKEADAVLEDIEREGSRTKLQS